MDGTAAGLAQRAKASVSTRDRNLDRLFHSAVAAAAWTAFALLLAAACTMAWGGREVFQRFGFGFMTGAVWDPVMGEYGALAAIYGTLLTSGIALILAVPIAFGIALFLTELAPGWIRTWVGAAIELLAGIPSIIYGMWGVFVLVPLLGEHVYPWMDMTLGPLPVIGALFRGPPIGVGFLTAGIVLAIMVLPFITAIMRDVFLTVPSRLKESAYALGSTTFEVVWDIVLPATRGAVVGGIFLGLGRALGETMAVTFVIGSTYQITAALLEPGHSITAVIANEFAEADPGMHRSALIALGFVLFAVSFVVLLLAKLMLRRLNRDQGLL
jgi:phosphate transport system permease protein